MHIGLIYEILKYASGSLFIGLLLAIALVVLLFVIIKGFFPRSTFSPVSIITGGVLLFFIACQIVPMCGAISLKWLCDDFQLYIESLLPAYALEEAIPLTQDQASELINRSLDEFPLIGYFVGSGTFEGHNTSNIASVMAETLDEFLNQFILKAILWSIAEMIIAAVIIIWTIDRSWNNRLASSRSTRRGGGSYRGRSSSYGRGHSRSSSKF